MDLLKLLIADDEENIRNGLKNILDWESLGIEICGAASNGKEAYQQIIDNQPDLVILDIKMPGLTGIQLLEKLSEYYAQQTVNKTDFKMPSIIILSGFAEFEYAQKALNAGAKAYLLKPVDEELLEKKIVQLSDAIRNSTHSSFFSNLREEILQKKIDSSELQITEEEFIQKLLFCIETYDKEKLQQNIEFLYKHFSDESLKEAQVKKDVISILVNLRNSVVEKYPERDFKETVKLDFVSEMLELDSFNSLIDHFKSVTENYIECFNTNTSDSMILKVVAYVKSNFNQDLKLENLGELFNCNSAYLGKKFKLYTGVPFNTFLDNLRIESAKDKLLNTNLKNYQIAKLIGFNNTDYFFMRFKKNTGLTPKEFKQQAGKSVDEE